MLEKQEVTAGQEYEELKTKQWFKLFPTKLNTKCRTEITIWNKRNAENILKINELQITLAGKDGSSSAKADSSKSFAHSSLK